VEAAGAPMPNLANGSLANESPGLDDRRFVAHHEADLAGPVDLERARGECLRLLRRPPDRFLDIERPAGVEHRAPLGGVAVVWARDVHKPELAVRERLLHGLDHTLDPERSRLVAEPGRTTGRVRSALRWLRAIDPNPTIAIGTVGGGIARIVAFRLTRGDNQ